MSAGAEEAETMFETRKVRTRIGLQILPTVLVVPFLFPLIAVGQGSLAGSGWGNYATVLSLPLLPGFFINSAIIAASVIVIVMICTMMAAFVFSKLHVGGKEIYFWLLLACLTLPGVVLL